MYKAIVLTVSLTSQQIQDDKEFWHVQEEYENSKNGLFSRLKLVEQVDSESLSLENLKLHGLKAAPQGPVKVVPELKKYMDNFMNDTAPHGFFPEEINMHIFEGSRKEVVVNVYERSSIARRKCIEYHGANCFVCGFNFERVYGEMGKGYIHIHHIVALHNINKEYKVDYKKDLVPVCPNCHSMLHRSTHKEFMDVEDLKKIVTSRIHK